MCWSDASRLLAEKELACLLWGEGDGLVLSEGEGDPPLEGSGQAVILSLLCYRLPLLHLHTDASAGPQCVGFSADTVVQQTMFQFVS